MGLSESSTVCRPHTAHAVIRRDQIQQAACDAELTVEPQARCPGGHNHEVVVKHSAEEGHPEEGRLRYVAAKGRTAHNSAEDGWQEGEEYSCHTSRRHMHKASDSKDSVCGGRASEGGGEEAEGPWE